MLLYYILDFIVEIQKKIPLINKLLRIINNLSYIKRRWSSKQRHFQIGIQRH